MGYGQLPYTLSRDASRLGGEGQRGEARRSFTRSLRVPRGPDSPYVFIERIYPAAAKKRGDRCERRLGGREGGYSGGESSDG
jgi:hypothetical protein